MLVPRFPLPVPRFSRISQHACNFLVTLEHWPILELKRVFHFRAQISFIALPFTFSVKLDNIYQNHWFWISKTAYWPIGFGFATRISLRQSSPVEGYRRAKRATARELRAAKPRGAEDIPQMKSLLAGQTRISKLPKMSNEGLMKNLLHFRSSDNSSKQDGSEAAFQVIGYRKPGGKVIHEHWV